LPSSYIRLNVTSIRTNVSFPAVIITVSSFFLTSPKCHSYRPHSASSFPPFRLTWWGCSAISNNFVVMLCALWSINIRSVAITLSNLLVALSVLADSYHTYLFCLAETWLTNLTISAELVNHTPTGFTIMHSSHPNLSKNTIVFMAIALWHCCSRSWILHHSFSSFSHFQKFWDAFYHASKASVQIHGLQRL
jgi:hypothetical protein